MPCPWLLSRELEKGTRLRPIALLVEVLHTLVDDDLTVLGERDAQALERPRRGAFEVVAGFIKAAAVARTLELRLRRQPARRAAEVRALREQRVKALFRADDPDAEIFLELLADLTDREVLREARLEARRRLEEHPRERRA